MSLKSEINTGFSVGDVTTSSYDESARIKIKDFYFLDELERKKLVKLAEKIDTELAIRDNKLEEIKNKLEDSGSDTGQSGNNMKMKKITNEPNKLWCVFSTVIPKSAVEKLSVITLDKYNALTSNQKYEVNYSLENMGLLTPITTEKIEAFLKGQPTGLQMDDLAYIYELFTEGYEVNDLNLEIE